MPHGLISEHEVKVFLALKGCGRWITAKDLAEKTNVANRTVRGHLTKFVKCGMADVIKQYPGYRYKLKLEPCAEAKAYIAEIEAVRDTKTNPRVGAEAYIAEIEATRNTKTNPICKKRQAEFCRLFEDIRMANNETRHIEMLTLLVPFLAAAGLIIATIALVKIFLN